jgi:hypothetical protein
LHGWPPIGFERFVPRCRRKETTVRKTVAFIALLAAVALLSGGRSPADDKKGAPDEKAAMEAMMKAAQPGEPHKGLAALAGSWEQTLKMWMDPSKPPTESKGTCESKMILGDRYLEDKVTSEFGGMKFLGQGLTAYDNLKKKYSFTWIDNMGTGVSTATGSYDAGKKTYTYQGEETDPISGKAYKTKMVTHVIDKDKYEMDMYRMEGDKEVKVMHIDAVRKK